MRFVPGALLVVAMFAVLLGAEVFQGVRARRDSERHQIELMDELHAVIDAFKMSFVEAEYAASLPIHSGWSSAPKHAMGVRGVVRGFDTWIVEYRSPIKSRWNTTIAWRYDVHGGRRIALGVPAPLAIRPQLRDEIGTELVYRDITTESAEFNDAFVFTCRDRRFASDLMHPLLMTWLMDECSGLTFEIRDEMLLLKIPARQLETGWTARWLGALVGFAERIPAFVYDDHPPSRS
jgi:hypothetical protein